MNTILQQKIYQLSAILATHINCLMREVYQSKQVTLIAKRHALAIQEFISIHDNTTNPKKPSQLLSELNIESHINFNGYNIDNNDKSYINITNYISTIIDNMKTNYLKTYKDILNQVKTLPIDISNPSSIHPIIKTFDQINILNKKYSKFLNLKPDESLEEILQLKDKILELENKVLSNTNKRKN